MHEIGRVPSAERGQVYRWAVDERQVQLWERERRFGDHGRGAH